MYTQNKGIVVFEFARMDWDRELLVFSGKPDPDNFGSDFGWILAGFMTRTGLALTERMATIFQYSSHLWPEQKQNPGVLFSHILNNNFFPLRKVTFLKKKKLWVIYLQNICYSVT